MARATEPEYVFTRDLVDNNSGSGTNRINLQHYLWVELFGYHLHPGIPTADAHLRIADAATGTRVEDHKIGSNIVFPAAGMIAMAIEAARQLFGNSEQLYGVKFHDAAFSHAISLPPGTDKIETQLTLTQPFLNFNAKAWAQFRLFALENGSYIECASGWIRAVFDERTRDRVALNGSWSRNGTLSDWISQVEGACYHGSERDPYDVPAGIEVQYGPAFQNLEHMRVGPHREVVARINTESWKLKSTGSVELSFAVHPLTLDGLAQPLLQALLVQRPGSLPTMVPVHVDKLWVDCTTDDLHHGAVHISAKCRVSGYRGGRADIVATAAENCNRPVMYMEGLETAFIVAILCFIEEALSYMDHHLEIPMEPHLEAYVGWMRYQQHQLRTGQSLVSLAAVQDVFDNSEDREVLNRQIEDSGVDGFFFIQIGQRVFQMLRREIDPLVFMFRDGLADRYYEKMLANDHHSYPASEFVDLMCFKNPSMNILEIGAGTGGQTMRLLETMSHDGGICKWSNYDYTDISPGFFSNAREKFSHFENINFRVCDISKDPLVQKFEAANYDMVIASHVLHATDKLEETLQNVRKLLKPDGKLLLFETTRPEAIPVGFAFGLLKGW
ncbi:Lovastatin diketide synthase LovF [Cytospora mali]|uniref:Lovastatin diketide synthase LovF n=1 Tax=Cytospora mali TaxID=578113 RepID=A0A194VLG7_CYTMA|nr:Lovastatin diketide synthase LovF [Valsa mali]